MLLLNASKAFDRIEYVRLFTLLRLRNMCPLVLRLIMNMYILKECNLDLVAKLATHFLGVFSYADALTLLCPSLAGLKQMLNVCEDYAKEYNILYNASKSKLMHFGKNYFDAQHVLHMSNGSKIDYVEQCVHLGTTLYSDISIRNINNAVNDLFMRTSILMADFSNAHSSTLSV